MIQNFDVYSDYLGNNSTAEYTFDFLITRKEDLKVIMLDDTGALVDEVDGTDTTSIISSVVYDSANGGGTVTLLSNLATDYQLLLILNPTEPKQTSSIKDKTQLNLRTIEQMFDYVTTNIQRLNFLANRSIRKSDKVITETTFDMSWPTDMMDNTAAGYCPVVNTAGTGLEKGFSIAEVDAAVLAAQAAQAAAEAAQAAAQLAETNAETAETNAETAETNAEAAQAAAEAAQTAAETARDQAIYDVQGSVATPELVDGASQVALTGVTRRHFLIIEGDGGAVDQSGVNPQVDPPLNDGDELTMLCNSNTNTVKFATGNGLVMNGDYVMVQNSMISFIGVNSIWVEKSRNNI